MQSKKELISYWIKHEIIKDQKVIEAFKKIPREEFISKEYLSQAYGDYPLSIGLGQTISQPTTVMIMTEALEVKEGHKILEIGTGSGYQAAILSYLVGKKGIVYTTEIIEELARFAESNIKKLNIRNVKVIYSDGSLGYKKAAPYDRIIVTAGSPRIPEELLKQLKPSGIMIVPVGDLLSQKMLKIIKKKKLEIKDLGNFTFVPLKGQYGH